MVTTKGRRRTAARRARKKHPIYFRVHTLGWTPGCPAGELHTFNWPVDYETRGPWLFVRRHGRLLTTFAVAQVRYFEWSEQR